MELDSLDLNHHLAVTPLCVSFLVCKIKIIKSSTSQSSSEDYMR